MHRGAGEPVPSGPTPQNERGWLEAFDIRPRKSLGQNFLLDPRIVREMVSRVSFPRGSPVLEIGAGGGSLTSALLAQGRSVTALEVDPALCRLLRARFEREIQVGRLTVLHGDVLETTLPPDPARPRASGAAEEGGSPGDRPFLAGNLPYGISTPVLLKALAARDRLCGALFMVQREYGERLLAKPGEKAYSSLNVWTAAHATTRLLLRVGRSAFWPRPGVESVVLEFLFPDPPPYPGDRPLLERVLRAAFGQRRKMLENALSHGLGLSKEAARAALLRAGCVPAARAEELALPEFARLVESLLAAPSVPSPEGGHGR